MKNLFLVTLLAVALAGCASDSWVKNMAGGAVVGGVGGAIVGAKTGWVAGPHAVAVSTATGAVVGTVVGATLPHKHF